MTFSCVNAYNVLIKIMGGFNLKTPKLTSEELEQMSYTDVANLILTHNGKKMKIQDLFSKVIEMMNLPESYFESKIGDFFALLSTDKRFIMLEKGYWDLRINHSNKIVIDNDDDEEEDLIVSSEEMDSPEDDEINDDEINYDDDTVEDEDDDDDLKDLVILDENDDQEMM